MEKYDTAVSSVMKFLIDNGYCSAVFRYYELCFRYLRIYLEENNLVYSKESADQWLNGVTDLYSKTALSEFKCALQKLDDVYQSGEISPLHFHGNTFTGLSENYQNVVIDYGIYLREVKNYTDSSIRNKKCFVSVFLKYTQDKGIDDIGELTYEDICRFYNSHVHKKEYLRLRTNNEVSRFLFYLSEKDLCPKGFSIILHYLFIYEDLFFADFSEELKEMVRFDEIPIIDNEKLFDLIGSIENDLRKEKYSKTVFSTYRKVLQLLYLFLDMNDLVYTPELSRVWFDSVKDHFPKEGRSERRALKILEEKIRGNEINYSSFYRYGRGKLIFSRTGVKTPSKTISC